MIAAALLAAAISVKAARAIAIAPRERPTWVRLELPQWIDPSPAGDYHQLRILDDLGRETPYVVDSQRATPMQLNATQTRRTGDRASTITFDLGTPNTRSSLLQFTTSQAEFSRDVSIQASDDGEQWCDDGSGHIQRFARGTPALEVPLSNIAARYVRVRIENGDDAPLADLHASLYGPWGTLVFIALPSRTYALVQTQGVSAPAYDLAELLAHDNPQTFEAARLAGMTGAPQNEQATAALFREPWVLPLTFGVVILVLGAVTLVTLRSGTPGGR